MVRDKTSKKQGNTTISSQAITLQYAIEHANIMKENRELKRRIEMNNREKDRLIAEIEKLKKDIYDANENAKKNQMEKTMPRTDDDMQSDSDSSDSDSSDDGLELSIGFSD